MSPFDKLRSFAALLGSADNGYWRIAPVDRDVGVRRRYPNDTLILETDFETADGAGTGI